MHGTTDRRLAEWLLCGETGLSSRTIALVLSGIRSGMKESCAWKRKWQCMPPGDASDFGRCAALLEFIPEWRGRMDEVAREFPGTAWERLVDRWDELTLLWEAGRARGGDYAALERRLREISAGR